ncbi:hypothetical protein KC19_7G183000, partial [Ceratodon purpureus]
MEWVPFRSIQHTYAGTAPSLPHSDTHTLTHTRIHAYTTHTHTHTNSSERERDKVPLHYMHGLGGWGPRSPVAVGPGMTWPCGTGSRGSVVG